MRDAFHCDCQNPDGYMVTVDRTLTLAQMLAAGDYREVPDLDPCQFPIAQGGRKIVHLALLHVHGDPQTAVPYHDVIAALKARKETLAGPEELLALGSRFPDLQRHGVILALGVIDGDPLFPDWATALALSGDEEGRYVETRFLENGIVPGTHVLVIR